METTIMGYIGYILGILLGLYWDDGKENGNYYIIHSDPGLENQTLLAV